MHRRKILDPNVVKAIEDFKLEMSKEIGGSDEDFIDDELMYVHTGELIPKEIIEEAERQLANNKEEDFD